MASIYKITGEVVKDIFVDDEVPLEASNDAFDIRGSNNVLINLKTKDTRCRLSAHCDHIQLIPEGAEPNAQYFAAIAKNNQIIGGGLESNGSMQGIFSSDGCFEDIIVVDQIIDTESQHKITINGVLSGEFKNNKNSHGEYLETRFEPLRVGGGLENGFYVLSFKNHKYQKIKSDYPIQDLREVRHRRGAKYVENFDLDLFREISESKASEYKSIGQHFNSIMREYSKKVRERQILDISVHCSATKEGLNISASDIRRWHKNQGWSDIGYHYVIKIDGTIERGRPLYKQPAAVRGKNKNMIAVCYIGGLDKHTLQPKDTRTPEQKAALIKLITSLKNKHPRAKVRGHRDYPKVSKACPCFDAQAEYSEL